jgi:asparaginyl-tRNA synthetase
MTDSTANSTTNSTPNTISVAAARRAEAVGREVVLQGWVRTRRDSKAGFSFLEINDGSCFGNIQVIAEASLPNYESEIRRLSPGCSVSVAGLIKASPGKGQATEVQAAAVTVHGLADVETYPLQKKGHSFEFLRTIAHLRPRTNTFGAIARVRNCVCNSIHQYFQEQGFLYVHTPLITASDCEGAGAMFQVTTLDLEKLPKKVDEAESEKGEKSKKGAVDFSLDFFNRPAYLTVSGQLR